MELTFTPSGRVQFLAAIGSIRRANSAAAARQFRQRAEKTLRRLERFPASGAVVAEFPDLPFREVYVKPYRFFYIVRDQTIWVVAVWHGAQIPQKPEIGRVPRDS
jgi:plasmid stabilization system protein ParE